MLNSMRDNNGSTFSLYKLKTSMCFRRGTRYSQTSRDIHDFSFLPSREITVRLKSAVCTTSKASSWIFLLQIRCVRQYQLPTELRVAPHPTLWPGVCVEHRCRTVLHMLHTAYPVVLSRLLGEDTVITCSHLLARISRYLPTTFLFETDRIDG